MKEAMVKGRRDICFNSELSRCICFLCTSGRVFLSSSLLIVCLKLFFFGFDFFEMVFCSHCLCFVSLPCSVHP